jgi:hypothetical protein
MLKNRIYYIRGLLKKSHQQVNYVWVARFVMGRNLDIWTSVVRTELRFQEKYCSNLLEVSVCYLTTLSIADILEFGWRMNERKKKTGGIILTGGTEVLALHPIQVLLYAQRLRHWQTCDWTHISLFRDFKYLIHIWIFMYSKWQKINCYTLTGNGAGKFMLKLYNHFRENINVLSVATSL